MRQLALLITLLPVCGTLIAQDLDEGLVARYRFDGALTDSTANAHHGNSPTPGATPGYVSGLFGQAAHFDGLNDAVRFPGIPNSAFTGDFSLAWFQRIPRAHKASVLGKRDACTVSNHFDIRLNDTNPTQVRFELSRTGQNTVAGGANLTPGDWVHMVAVRQGTNAVVYTNGVAGTTVTPGTLNFAGIVAPFGISTSPCIGGFDSTVRFEGEIDELRVYSRALSPGEIAALAAGEGVTGVGPVSVTPRQVTAGGDVRVSIPASAVPSGPTTPICTVRLGSGGATIGSLAQVGGRWQTAITIPPATSPAAYDVHVRCSSATVVEIGRDRLQVAAVPQLQLERPSGHTGLDVGFTASGLIGERFELWSGTRRLYGPVPVDQGVAEGRFVVPTSSFGTVTLRGQALTGDLPTSRVEQGFTRNPDPGYRVRLIENSVPTAPAAETAYLVEGRIEAADGRPGLRTVNLYFRASSSGRVIPLGPRDVVPGADGRFQMTVEMPSAATQDGYTALGPGEFFYLVSEADPATGGLRTTRMSAGFVTATGYPDFGNGARAELTVRDPQGNPVAGAYVRVAGGSYLVQPEVVNTSGVSAGPTNQYSPAGPGGGATVACPLSLGEGYTDANGRFDFAIDPNAARRLALARGAECLSTGNGCLETLSIDTTISVFGSHLGLGASENGVSVPTVIPAEYRPGAAGSLNGRFFNPATNLPYNTGVEVWRPSLTLSAIDPSLTVQPYRRIGPATGSTDPGGSEYLPLPIALIPGGGGRLYIAGRHYNTASAHPVGCAPDQVCVTSAPQGALELYWFHDANISGTVNLARLVVCSNDRFDCTGPNITASYPLVADAGNPGGAACGLGQRRYTVTMPQTPVLNQRVRGRIEIQTTYIPPGGTIGQVLEGRAPVQVTLDDLPDWFNGPSTRFRNRVVHQYANGAVNLSGIESMTGGGPNRLSASSSQFNEVNLPSPQDSSSDNDRLFEIIQVNAGSPPTLDASDFDSRNDVANNEGSPVGATALTLPTLDALRLQDIIDTGRIPLFRFTYGLPPIADATLGADFWLQAAIRYGGLVSFEQEVPSTRFITEPFSEFGIAVFFDLSAIAGLVSASIEAIASVYLSNRSVYDSSVAFTRAPDQCFGFKLDVEIEVCVLVCTSTTENLISVYEADDLPACVSSTNGLPIFPNVGNTAPEGPILPRPSLRVAPDASIAYAADGRGGMTYADSDGRLVLERLPPTPVRAEGISVLAASAERVTSTATAAFATGRGMVIWSEVPGNPTSIEADSQRQRIRWVEFGPLATGLNPQDLTPPGSGDGNVTLAVCPDGLASCPAGGEVTAAWVRRIGARWEDHHTAIMAARYRPATGWTAPQRVDPAQGQASDLHPTVAYRTTTGVPVIAWARKSTPGLRDFETRRVTYRFMDGFSPVRQALDLPAGISWPSLTRRFVNAGAIAVEELALAYTVNVDPVAIPGRPRAFVGNTNALHVARCSFAANGSLNCTGEELKDRFGRNLRAEKPVVMADSGGALAITFNGLGFGPDLSGNTQRRSDPIGMLSGQGDLVLVRPRLDGSPVSLIDLDVGSIGAMKPAAAYNPALDLYDAVSQPLNLGGANAIARLARQHGIRLTAKGESQTLADASRRATLPAGPDLAIEAAAGPAGALPAGSAIAVTVGIRNLGRAVTPASPADLRLVASWDGPETAAPIAASVDLPSMATDEFIERTLMVPVPPEFAADQTHALVLTVATGIAIGEVDGRDNTRALYLGAMPVPADPVAQGEPGQPVVFLRWSLDDPLDDRAAGFRVYEVLPDDSRIPLGSTPVMGFADLSAVMGQSRRYVVVSYSADGVPSGESAVVRAAPVPARFPGADPLLIDGFEDLLP